MNVIELFAGVGGFRVGLDKANELIHIPFYHTIWSNQFEPATKRQHASEIYARQFGKDGHVNKDIAFVDTRDIPNCHMLCAGFPCQDYSVASILDKSKGILGKKGVLWWQIERIIREMGGRAPEILMLENVDRILLSPASQRGRDFAIILQSLADLDYTVEWRVINAADYGMPQRRRRTYILAYKNNSFWGNSINDEAKWILSEGVLAKAFPCFQNDKSESMIPFCLKKNVTDELSDVSKDFNATNKERPFCNAGIMRYGKVLTCNVSPSYKGPFLTLKDVLAKGDDRKLITGDFYLSEKDIPKWKYLKGSKREERKSKNGYTFIYSEGAMPFPDPIDRPSRTIITSEGGAAPSRFKHVIKDPVNGRLRRLIPLELERLNMFPDNHTFGLTDSKRAFLMGNALVCGIITKIGLELYERLKG